MYQSGCHDEASRLLTLGQALQGRQRLTTVSLLDTDVYVIGLRPNVFVSVERVSLVCEGVCAERGKSVSLSTESIAPRPAWVRTEN